MSRWFRHYAGMMRDDKLVRVALRSKQPIERVVWVWGAILESAAEIDEDGRYDFDAAEAAWFLRADENDLLAVESALADAGHVVDGAVVKWSDRQFKSDRSAERQSRYRQRRKEGSGDDEQTERSRERDDGVTSPSRHGDAPETETETETETKKKVTAGAATDYAFSGRVIRLKRADYNRWRTAHPKLDLPAVLQSRDDWLATEADDATRAKWFISTSNYLASQSQRMASLGTQPTVPL